ncbi:DNA polymerase III subunit beta [Thioclava litoralis]|uniref:Beta sliding clamp n=1 Tax=Thioclava litoralis TaxID=3076557 RepID=A0ABZ1DZK6_9RHOB|nr:DNA polymerase III subunit beta [Thioclava sp. FTW29]
MFHDPKPPVEQATRLRCDAADLHKAVKSAKAVINRHNTIPIIGMLLLAFDGETLTVTATDLDMRLELEVETEAPALPFSVTVKPETILPILRNAKGTVTISLEGDMATIIAGDITAKIRQVCPAEDFPTVWADDYPLNAVEMPESALHKALSKVCHCISMEETRYYLNGIYMHEKAGKLATAATDGHRLALYQSDLDWPFLPVIVPRETVPIILQQLAERGNKAVMMTTSAKDKAPSIAIQGDGWNFRAKTIDGTYPDYQRVIPTQPEKPAIAFTLSKGAVDCMHQSERGATLRIHADEGRMWLSDLGKETEVSAPVTGRGELCAFNLSYVKAFLQKDKIVRLQSNNQGDPFHIITEDPAFTQIIMPKRA